MAKKPFYHTNHGHFLYDLLINPNKWISLEKQSGHWRPFILIFFKTRDDMLSQCLVLPITKKVIFYKLVLRQQPLIVLIKIRIRQKKIKNKNKNKTKKKNRTNFDLTIDCLFEK